MATFFLTFPQRYRLEPHPLGHDVHPDGWVEIEADTYEQARAKAFEIFDEYWAFLYDKNFMPDLYPRGCLMTIEAIG